MASRILEREFGGRNIVDFIFGRIYGRIPYERQKILKQIFSENPVSSTKWIVKIIKNNRYHVKEFDKDRYIYFFFDFLWIIDLQKDAFLECVRTFLKESTNYDYYYAVQVVIFSLFGIYCVSSSLEEKISVFTCIKMKKENPRVLMQRISFLQYGLFPQNLIYANLRIMRYNILLGLSNKTSIMSKFLAGIEWKDVFCDEMRKIIFRREYSPSEQKMKTFLFEKGKIEEFYKSTREKERKFLSEKKKEILSFSEGKEYLRFIFEKIVA